ncbi:hypothetical protein DRQ07_11480 [candidate division KSB1 bacterium]|nr:MAG: hypothetical protein DRQ07_11480 [candidate division KSB1 bacterium]
MHTAVWFTVLDRITGDLGKNKNYVFLVNCPLYHLNIYSKCCNENNPEILQFVQAGRIIPVPFYCNQTEGHDIETLIRNIFLAKKYGLKNKALILRNKFYSTERIKKILNKFGINEIYISENLYQHDSNGSCSFSVLKEGSTIYTIKALKWSDYELIEASDNIAEVPENKYYQGKNKWFYKWFLKQYFEPLFVIKRIWAEDLSDRILPYLWENYFISADNLTEKRAEKLIYYLFKSGKMSDTKNQVYEFAVFNPVPYQIESVVKSEVSDSVFPENITIVSKDTGREVPFQINKSHPASKTATKSLLIYDKELPPVGIKKYEIKKNQNRLSDFKGVKSGRFYLENDFIKAEADAKGLLKIIDKKSGNVFNRIGKFELLSADDKSSIKKIDFKEQPARISLASEGPLEARIRVRKRIKIKNRQKNGYFLVKTRVTYSLRYNSSFLEIKTEIEQPEDKYVVNILFPSGCQNTRESLNMSDNSIRKHIHTNKDIDRIKFDGFLLITGSKRSIAVFSKQPSFYRIILDNLRTVSINVYNTFTDTNKQGGIFRQLSELSILTGTDNTDQGIEDLIKEYQKFSLNGFMLPGEIDIDEDSVSLFSLENNRVSLLAVKPVENRQAYIIRMANNFNKNIYETVKFKHEIFDVYECNLSEEMQGKLSVKNRKIKLEFDPGEIKTLMISHELINKSEQGKSIA